MDRVYLILMLGLVLSCKHINHEKHTSGQLKVYGGYQDDSGEYMKYTVAIGKISDDSESDEVKYTCTGSKISATHYLTAAHCVVDSLLPFAVRRYPDNKIYFKFAELPPETREGYLVFESTIKKIHIHPSFQNALVHWVTKGGLEAGDIIKNHLNIYNKAPAISFDAAIIEVEESHEAIEVAQITSARPEFGNSVIMSGYGCKTQSEIECNSDQYDDRRFPAHSLAEKVVVDDIDVSFYNPEFHFMTQEKRGLARANDSGSPVFQVGTSFIQGIASQGGNKSSDQPPFQTHVRVDKIKSWIDSVLSGTPQEVAPYLRQSSYCSLEVRRISDENITNFNEFYAETEGQSLLDVFQEKYNEDSEIATMNFSLETLNSTSLRSPRAIIAIPTQIESTIGSKVKEFKGRNLVRYFDISQGLIVARIVNSSDSVEQKILFWLLRDHNYFLVFLEDVDDERIYIGESALAGANSACTQQLAEWNIE